MGARRVAQEFGKRRWKFGPCEAKPHLYEAQMSVANLDARLLTCCSYEDTVFAGTVKQFAKDASMLAALNRHYWQHLYFYAGDPVESFVFDSKLDARLILGGDLARGQRPQRVVPAGAWQATRLVEGGAWALLGTTMSPGFDPADFELARASELIPCFPAHRDTIEAFCRDHARKLK